MATGGFRAKKSLDFHRWLTKCPEEMELSMELSNNSCMVFQQQPMDVYDFAEGLMNQWGYEEFALNLSC